MGRWLACVCGVLVLSASVAHAQTRYDEVLLADGERALGHLVANNPDGEVVLVSPTGELLRWPHALVTEVLPADADAALLPYAPASPSRSLLRAELDAMNAQAPMLGAHHTESHESVRIGGWMLIVGGAGAGLAMVLGALFAPRVAPPGYPYYQFGTYWTDSGGYVLHRGVYSEGSEVLLSLGLLVGVACVAAGMKLIGQRDVSMPGAMPQRDFTVQRPLGPSF